MLCLVYVVNQNGHALMPCKPSKARKLLRDGRARVKERSPFTIQLLWDCEEHVQEVVVGIDKGSSVTGLACVGKGEILLSGEIVHRRDVKEKMEARLALCPAPSFATTKLNHERSVTGGDRKKAFFGTKKQKNVYSHFNLPLPQLDLR
jgi:RRXRR protein